MISKFNRLRQLPVFALLLTLAPLAPAESPSTKPADVRQAFLKLIDRPKVALDAKEEKQPAKDGFVQTNFSYSSEANQRVPGILLEKESLLTDGKRHPVAIFLHGTGGKKESVQAYMKTIAGKGFIGVGIDGRFHGERGSSADYNDAIAKAFDGSGAHPFYFDTVWDVCRLIDYLQTRADVDPARIGLMGFSKGGIETWLTAAVDQRVACAIPCIGMQSFEWALEHDAWKPRVGTVQKAFTAAAKSAGVEKPDAAFCRKFYDKVIPGIYTQFDGPVMVTLICPRPLLVINGDKDDKTPLDGVKLCAESAERCFAAAGSSEKFRLIVQPDTGHAVKPDAQAAAAEWFMRWLGDQ